MKAIQTLLMAGLLAATVPVAGAQTNTVTANTTANTTAKPQAQHSFPRLETAAAIKLTLRKDREHISQYQGLSSQPWAVMANRRPDESLLRSCGVTEADFPLVTVSW